MSKEQSVTVSPVAHVKMILHACRNPHSAVHGVLVGGFDKTSGDAPAGPTLSVLDAIPCFHSSPTKPILDMALRLVEAHLENSISGGGGGSTSVGIVGWYSANERLTDDERPGQAALRIIGGLASGMEAMGKSIPTHSELVTILISNQEALDLLKGEGSGSTALKIFGRDARKHWLRPYAENVKCTSASVVRAAFLEGAEQVPMFDFEDHMDGGLDDLDARDWLSNSLATKFVQKAA